MKFELKRIPSEHIKWSSIAIGYGVSFQQLPPPSDLL